MSKFGIGQVWESPRGFLYKVVKVSLAEQATLRSGTDGKGRIVRRNVNDNINWKLQHEETDGGSSV